MNFDGSWLLLVEGGPPTKDKPGVAFEPPRREHVGHSFTIRCFYPDPDGHL